MCTVLLVEPNESLRELTRRHLAVVLSKVEVVATPDVARALAVLEDASCHALVVAWELPGDGALALLTAAAALEHPPALFVTTVVHATPAAMERCPPATWLLKPYSMEELEDCLRLALRPPGRVLRAPQPIVTRSCPSLREDDDTDAGEDAA